MSEARNSPAPVKRTDAANPELEENSIGPARRRARAAATLAPAAQPEQSRPPTRPKQSEAKQTVP